MTWIWTCVTLAPRKSSSLKHRRMAPGCNMLQLWPCDGWKPNCKVSPYESSETIIILLFVLSEALKRSWDGSCQTLPCCEFHLNFEEENLKIMEQTENDMKRLDVSRTVIKVVFIGFPFPSASLAFLTSFGSDAKLLLGQTHCRTAQFNARDSPPTKTHAA